MIDAAFGLADLGALPGNRLEVLKGDRKGQHSIRINDQFRVCFTWHEGNAGSHGLSLNGRQENVQIR